MKIEKLCLLLLTVVLSSTFVLANSGVNDKASKEYVVLLHGLGRTAKSMSKIESELKKSGYVVKNIGYPSRKYPIETLKKELEENKQSLPKAGELQACRFAMHLFQPLFHVRKNGKITILPVALNESEFQFVKDLKDWSETNATQLQKDGAELFLLRNLSRGKGVGFFEAGNFHPDFILWMIVDGKQYVTFIEPHGLLHEGPASEKVQFHKRIKDIESRFANPDVILNSFILSWTKYHQLLWGIPQNEMEANHVLFMSDGRYIDKLFDTLRGDVIT